MASSVDARQGPIKNAPFRVCYELRDSTTDQVKTGVAAFAAVISKDQADTGAIGDNSAHEVGSRSLYYSDLSESEMSADHIVLKVTATNTKDRVIDITPYAGLSSGLLSAGGTTTVTLKSANSSAVDDYYNGCVISVLRGTGAGQTRVITDYVGSTRVATLDRAFLTATSTDSVYIIEGVANAVGSDAVASANAVQLNGNAAAAANLKLHMDGLITGTVNDAAATTTSFVGSSGFSATNDEYKDMALQFTSGTHAGVARRISAYTGSTKTFTFTPALTSAPANAVTICVIGLVR